MASTSTQKETLTLLADCRISTAVEVDRMKVIVLEQLALIGKMESEAALRAILAGCALHRIKVSLGPKGGFGDWCAANVEQKKSQINNYMRLAKKFLDRVKPSKPELMALDGGDGQLVPQSENALARRLFERAQTFVGDKSLTELLVKFGIKKATQPDDDEDESGGGGGGGGGRAGEQMLFPEIADHLSALRDMLRDPKQLMQLQPKQLDSIKQDLDDTRTQFLKLYNKARRK